MAAVPALGVQTMHYDTYDALSVPKRDNSLAGKAVLVTGGGSGLGTDLAASFARSGARSVTIAGRTASSLTSTVASLAAQFPDVRFAYATVDLEKLDTVTALFDGLAELPDVLVNNAGYLPDKTLFFDGDVAEWWRGFTINMLGTAFVTQTFLRRRRQLKTQTGPAAVLFINTGAAWEIPVVKMSGYSSSKAALARWAEGMAAEVPESEARFISIHPGVVRTAMFVKSEFDTPDMTDARLTGDFVAWSASDEAAFLNGRFAWVNWDVDELVAKKDEIASQDLLKAGLKGFSIAGQFAAPN